MPATKRKSTTKKQPDALSSMAATFDNLHHILLEKDSRGTVNYGQIFAIDGDEKNGPETLIELVNLIKTGKFGEVKVAVLFRCGGHTTPICIEKRAIDAAAPRSSLDSSGISSSASANSSMSAAGDSFFMNSSASSASAVEASSSASSSPINPDTQFEVVVYNTDSVVFDIDDIQSTKDTLKSLAETGIATVYSLGFEDPEGEILESFKRQSDTQSCATFALHDVEELLQHEFYTFAAANSVASIEIPNLHTLTSLPAYLMTTMQSINGEKGSEGDIRKGLLNYLDATSLSLQHTKDASYAALKELVEKARDNKKPNKTIDEANKNNMELYNYGINIGGNQRPLYSLNYTNVTEGAENVARLISEVPEKVLAQMAKKARSDEYFARMAKRDPSTFVYDDYEEEEEISSEEESEEEEMEGATTRRNGGSLGQNYGSDLSSNSNSSSSSSSSDDESEEEVIAIAEGSENSTTRAILAATIALDGLVEQTVSAINVLAAQKKPVVISPNSSLGSPRSDLAKPFNPLAL